MLIIPLTNNLSKKNPPIITILLILINCFIYFVLQSGDTQKYHQAMSFYFSSDLSRIEVFRYLEYLEITKPDEKVPHVKDQGKLTKTIIARYYSKMMKDGTFMQKLMNDRIITVDEEIYANWKSLRDKFDYMLSKLTSMRYGFIPAFPRLFKAVSYMFIHGSISHVIGNMIFLWLVGCVLELGCGRIVYTVLYLLTGVLSVGLYYLVYMDSVVPLIGASGAISGLMGAYTLLFGKRKIKIFYSLGFYFNYTKIYAVILLPIWIGNELVQLFFGGPSQVAYVGHLGGLLSGALLGYVSFKVLGQVDEEVMKEDPKEVIDSLLEEAMQKIGKLDMSGARPLLEQVLENDPNNTDALIHLFNLDKLNPQSEIFHKTTSRLLIHLSSNMSSENRGRIYDIYKEYSSIAKPLRLHPDLLFRISSILSAQGHLEESAKIIAMLLQKYPKSKKLPTVILNLARAYLKNGVAVKGEKCLRILCKRYPGSTESQIAQRLLQGSK